MFPDPRQIIGLIRNTPCLSWLDLCMLSEDSYYRCDCCLFGTVLESRGKHRHSEAMAHCLALHTRAKCPTPGQYLQFWLIAEQALRFSCWWPHIWNTTDKDTADSSPMGVIPWNHRSHTIGRLSINRLQLCLGIHITSIGIISPFISTHTCQILFQNLFL